VRSISENGTIVAVNIVETGRGIRYRLAG
jgi:hypothetical protein